MATYEKRAPQDDVDRRLVSVGWKLVGFVLFEYPNNPELRGYYTKEQAVAKTEELMLDVYCAACGACGEEGCCSPDRCICFYGEHYDKAYKDLADEHERFLRFVQGIKALDEGTMISTSDLIDTATELLQKMGYEDNEDDTN